TITNSARSGMRDPLESPLDVPSHGRAIVTEADVSRARDVDREQMRRPWPRGVGPIVRDLLGSPVHLEVAGRSLPVTLRAVYGEARVSEQVQRLAGLPHHPEHQLALLEDHLTGADPRRPVGPEGPHEAEARRSKELLSS